MPTDQSQSRQTKERNQSLVEVPTQGDIQSTPRERVPNLLRVLGKSHLVSFTNELLYYLKSREALHYLRSSTEVPPSEAQPLTGIKNIRKTIPNWLMKAEQEHKEH